MARAPRGKVAVVTGGGSGIGAAIAMALGECGARVAVLDLHADAAAEVAARTSEGDYPAIGIGVDTTDPEGIAAAAQTVAQEIGPASVLVNNAGIMRSAGLDAVSLADWQRVLDVNLTGYLLCSRAFRDQMIDLGSGSIVHISSISAAHPQPLSGAYSPSKAAVSMLSRSLAFE